jgi:hypothetical protein
VIDIDPALIVLSLIYDAHRFEAAACDPRQGDDGITATGADHRARIEPVELFPTVGIAAKLCR